MKEIINEIFIIPAKFIEKINDKYVIRCFVQDDHTEDRLFDEYSLKGIKNPKYLFIGIISGIGFTQINFTNANDFEKMFKRKWKILTK